MENPLLELQEYENLLEALKKAKGPLQAAGTLESQKVHLMHELGEDGDFPGSWLLPMMSRGPRKSMMISAALPGRSGFIRPRICFFMLRIFMEI